MNKNGRAARTGAETERLAKAFLSLYDVDECMAFFADLFTVKEIEELSSRLEVARLLKAGELDKAQSVLDAFDERGAEWHYLQAVIFYKKNWMSESKKQLEIAVNMDPANTKYSDALTKLRQKMEYNDRQFQSGYAQGPQGAGAGQQQNRQMGATDSCCNFCTCWCLTDLLCSMCCR